MKTVVTLALTIFVLAGCHLEQPFEGPGYVLGEGLTTEAPGPFVGSTTNLFIVDGDEAKRTFDANMAVLTEQIKTQPGLIGYSLAMPIGTEGWRTLTVWETEDAMLEWVVSDAHSAAMSEMADKAKPESAVASWSVPREELEAGPPSWEDAKARLDADGRTVY